MHTTDVIRRGAVPRQLKVPAMMGLLVFLVSACGGGGGSNDTGTPPPPQNSPPTASFTVTPANGAPPLTVQFDASASSDNGGSITAYAWSFGDSSAAGSGVTTSHDFLAAGNYTVTLTVTDNGGATASTSHQVSVIQTVALSTIASIDVGDATACAVGVDGKAWCWGPNDYAQLGTGDTAPGYVPRVAAEGRSFHKISVSTGGAFACGIATDGRAYCWGNQEGGRLGDGVTGPPGQFVTAPVPVSGGRTFIDIATGGDHACAIATGGAAYCWGHNEQGQHGTGNFANSAVPVAVTGGLSFTSITTHQMVTCAIAAGGAGYCWGYGEAGNLGTGSRSSTNVPVQIKGGLSFSSLRLGGWTACGVTTIGDGYCWGFNGSGELGIGSKTPAEALEPLKVAGGHAWKSISPGVSVTCGVTTQGGGFCWGGNTMGERGDGPFPAADVASPVPVVGDLVFDSIDADWSTCGVASGIAYCWGPGEFGSIGDGARVDRGVPTRVAGQP
jgi:alpha-tubulin suppressor-like RCC1 family protein